MSDNLLGFQSVPAIFNALAAIFLMKKLILKTMKTLNKITLSKLNWHLEHKLVRNFDKRL